MKKILYMSIGICLPLLLVSSMLRAQGNNHKYLETDTFMEMESVSDPNISPDGKRIPFP
jgi:hypothetical protein